MDDDIIQAVTAGMKWLIGLQNHDGGIPTFCRGWSALPFDRSAPDITAHTVAAMGAWFYDLPAGLQKQVDKSIKKSLAYLQRIQREDGSWVPLWFGNQSAPNHENPVYGTSRVLSGLSRLPKKFSAAYVPMIQKGGQWLLSIQNRDGGWGGAESVGSTVEETALSVDALTGLLPKGTRTNTGKTKFSVNSEALQSTISRGVSWLIENTKAGTSVNPSAIGLYFARLWYYEQLYPVIFTISALQKIQNLDVVT